MIEGVSVLTLGLLFLCILLSAFFSSSEAAFLSVQRVKVRHMVSTGVAGARRMASMTEHPERLLPTVLLGNNLVNTAAAALGTTVALTLINDTGTAILAATIGVTVLLLIFGETLPKTVAVRHPERVALLYAIPLQWMERLLFPLARVLQGITLLVVSRLTGGVSQRALVTEEEIKVLISLGRETGVVEHAEAEMLGKVFRFGDRQVQEVMTPRTEIVWIEQGMTLAQFLEVSAQQYHSRFPMYGENMDNVLGILSVRDVVQAMVQGNLQPTDSITHRVRPAPFVPETKLVGPLLAEMREQGNRLVMVADEFGGVAGLVTVEQLVDEIVGRMREEGGVVEEEFRVIDEHTLQVNGSMRIDEANEQLELNLPEGEYETVAGFLLERLGRIPQEGEELDYNGLRLVVTQMRGVKIEKVTITQGVEQGKLDPP